MNELLTMPDPVAAPGPDPDPEPARPIRGTLFDVFKKKFSKSLSECCDRLPRRGTFFVTFKKKPGVSVLTVLLLHMQ